MFARAASAFTVQACSGERWINAMARPICGSEQAVQQGRSRAAREMTLDYLQHERVSQAAGDGRGTERGRRTGERERAERGGQRRRGAARLGAHRDEIGQQPREQGVAGGIDIELTGKHGGGAARGGRGHAGARQRSPLAALERGLERDQRRKDMRAGAPQRDQVAVPQPDDRALALADGARAVQDCVESNRRRRRRIARPIAHEPALAAPGGPAAQCAQ
jgi:hypothetical protein